jgi:hypothetical protein
VALTINGVVITNPSDIAEYQRALAQEIQAQGFLIDAKIARRPDEIAAAQELLNQRRGIRLSIQNTVVANAQAASTPPASSGAQTQQAQAARDDRANPQSPPGPPLAAGPNGRVAPAQTPPPTNARPANTNAANAGTNAPTRTGANTQATPANTAQPVQRPGNTPPVGAASAPYDPKSFSARATNALAAVTGGDDAYTSALRSRINSFVAATPKVVTQANSLAQYYSYTYNVSIYIMSPGDYKKLVSDKKRNISGYQLLMQSGGAPFVNSQAATPQGAAPVSTGNNAQAQQVNSAGRNQYFPLDFYLDDIKITSKVPGKGSGSPHMIQELSFKILEPNGISLLDNLYNACQAYVGKKQNYNSQNYLMVIKFYGYDQNGNLVRTTGFPAGGSSTEPGVVVEKYIPFRFNNITFRVANKITEYNCTCMVPQNGIASGQGRGTIPYNIELSAKTLNDVFNSGATFSNTSIFDKLRTLISGGRETQSRGSPGGSGTSGAPPKAGSGPTATLTSGLVDALNKYEQEHVDNGIFEVADEYAVVFTDNIIATAETTPPGSVVKGNTPMNNNNTASQQKNPNKQSVDVGSKNTSATAGTSIIQFIDQTIRNSRYIYDQQTKIIDPETQKEKPNGTAAKSMAWYRVGLQVEPKNYDYKRNDYAYKITYQISPYLVNDIKSDYFPKSEFRGVHKRYAYWFTGENSEVLSFEQNFNALYYMVVNSTQQPLNQSYDYREVEKRMYQTRSNQSDQGQAGKVNEPGANAADRLYSPSDLQTAKLQIVGDPAWIFQGEVWSGIAGASFKYDAFLPDGTINPEAGQVLFEIAWNKPVDYNLDTGIQDPYQTGSGANSVIGTIGTDKPSTTQSFVYTPITITSSFSQGKFTQDVDGYVQTFPIKEPDKAPPTLTQKILGGAASGARAVLNAAENNKSNDILSLTAKVGAKLINGAIKGVEYVSTKVGANSAQTAVENAARSQLTPVPSTGAKPPTSNGQLIGTAASSSTTRQPSGGTPVNTVTSTTFNENAFRTNNPVAWSQYTQYKQAEQLRLYDIEQKSLTRQAQNGVIFNSTISPRQQTAINNKAQQISAQQAQQNALKVFQNPIAAAGAGGTTTSTTPANAAQLNTRSYTTSKDK